MMAFMAVRVFAFSAGGRFFPYSGGSLSGATAHLFGDGFDANPARIRCKTVTLGSAYVEIDPAD